MRRTVVLAVLLFLTGIAVPVVTGIWYTTQQIRHECAALDLLTSVPPPPHSPPLNVRFYEDLLSWARSDGCLPLGISLCIH